MEGAIAMAAVGGQIYGVLRGSLAVQCRIYYVPLGTRLLSQFVQLTHVG